MPYAPILDGKSKIHLDRFDPEDTHGLDKEEAQVKLAKLGEELNELANLLAYSGKKSLLVVLQGPDASGKDGAIRQILDHSNVLTARAEPFKVPTEIERAHDFLWRVHARVPARGHIVIFNRSHYEDVIAARVHNIVPPEVWKARFGQINAFEDLLVSNDTILLKFYLHVSKEEQHQRLVEREKDPRTAWKLNPGDWRERAVWKEVRQAYEEALQKCSSPDRPFYLVSANKKWFRNVAIVERVVLALRPYKDEWLEALKTMRKGAIKEIRALRREGNVHD